jgi:ketosteroid isomerase-like protein
MKHDLHYLLEKTALEEALLRYGEAIDKFDDIEFMMENFTEDAVLDLTGLQLPRFEGHAQIRGFYEQVFKDMTHHMHLMSNFRVVSLEDTQAKIYAYVTGMGRSKAGVDILVYVYYDLTFRKVNGTWKIAHFYEAPKMPMPESVTQVHARS